MAQQKWTHPSTRLCIQAVCLLFQQLALEWQAPHRP